MNINEKIEQAEKLLTELKAELQTQPEKEWPQKGDRVWLLGTDGDIWESPCIPSGGSLQMGSGFRTQEDAKAARQQRIDSHKQWAAQREVLAALEATGAGGWVGGKLNYSPNIDSGRLTLYYATRKRQQAKHWYATKDQWQRVIDKLGEDVVVLALLGGE